MDLKPRSSCQGMLGLLHIPSGSPSIWHGNFGMGYAPPPSCPPSSRSIPDLSQHGTSASECVFISANKVRRSFPKMSVNDVLDLMMVSTCWKVMSRQGNFELLETSPVRLSLFSGCRETSFWKSNIALLCPCWKSFRATTECSALINSCLWIREDEPNVELNSLPPFLCINLFSTQ